MITTRNMVAVDPMPATRLREARIAAGYARAIDFYSKHGINQGTYSQHEGGERGIRPAVAAKYARLLGNCTAGWILHGEGAGPRRVLPPDGGIQQTPEIKGPSEKMAAFMLLRDRVFAMAKEYEEAMQKEFGEVPRIFGFDVSGGEGSDLAFFLWQQIENEDNNLSLVQRAEERIASLSVAMLKLAQAVRELRDAIMKGPAPKDGPSG